MARRKKRSPSPKALQRSRCVRKLVAGGASKERARSACGVEAAGKSHKKQCTRAILAKARATAKQVCK